MKSIIEITFFDQITGNDQILEVFYFVQNDSFSHEFGTENVPAYVSVEKVCLNGKELNSEELEERFETNEEEIACEIEKILTE